MGETVRVTNGPTTVTKLGTTSQVFASQPFTEVLAFKSLNLFLHVYDYQLGSATSITVSVETSMLNTTDDDALWKNLVTFTALTSGSGIVTEAKFTSGNPMLRYLRWKVVIATAAATSFTFEVTGVGYTT